jgi:uncharacterized protein YjbI with pentapeptide repeats
MSVSCLPEDILRLLGFYVVPIEARVQGKFRLNYDWRNFLNTSQTLFRKWKKQNQYLNLNKIYSKIFLHSPEFHARILEIIESSSLQLSLDFKLSLDERQNMKDHSFFLHPPEIDEIRLEMKLFTQIELFSHIRKLYLNLEHPFFIYDLSCLQQVEELICFNMKSVTNYDSLTKLKKAKFHHCDSCFANLSELVLVNCYYAHDVSFLRNVPKLTFDSCEMIEDVSDLGNVTELTIRNCPRIGDISSLSAVFSLTLSDRSFNDISCLVNVTVLNISNFSGANFDLSFLQDSSVRELDISNTYASDVTMLHNVVKLNMSDCLQIRDLSGLKSLKELNVRSGFHYLDIQSGWETFSQLTSLAVGEVEEPTKIIEQLARAPLTNLEIYRTHSSPTSKICSACTKLRKLTIAECSDIPTIPFLPALGELISYCSHIQSLIISGANESERNEQTSFPIYYVTIEACSVNFLIISRPVAFLQVRRCPKLVEERINDKTFIKQLSITQ